MDGNGAILVTGAAGFIGFHLSQKLLGKGLFVVGVDNLNDYYDVSLKESRLNILTQNRHFDFFRGDISDANFLKDVFRNNKIEIVVNLAAQAGVRYSIDHPRSYIDSNIIGFFNILECCRYGEVAHLVFASSSSVYGNSSNAPFKETFNVDFPVSLYAATKKSDELMAYTYCHLYGVPSTGLRFFTVYGPYGRPDMAYFKFTNRIMNDEYIDIYNNGDMLRDFTYIDDIVEGIYRVMNKIPNKDSHGDRYKIYNIGNSCPVKLIDFISILEHCIGKEAKKKYLPMQPGDVYETYADVTELFNDVGFKPNTKLEDGIKKFADWYMEFYGNKNIE